MTGNLITEVRADLDRMDNEFRMALPPHIAVEKFKRVAITAIQSDPALLKADRKSLIAACIKCAQDGLLPDKREAALVIYNTKSREGGVERWIDAVQYLPMVGGILKRVRNSGELASIMSQIVYRNDVFRYWVDTTGEHIVHEPKMFDERGEIVGVYALAKTKDGAVYIETMTKAQVEKVRSASRTKDRGPWVTWWEEMARKTAIRRLSKRLPMSTDIDEFLSRGDIDDDIHVPDRPVRQQSQPEASQAAIEQHTDIIQVIDEFGGVEYEGLNRDEAIEALKRLADNCASDADLDTLAENNPDLWSELYPASASESAWDRGGSKSSERQFAMKHVGTKEVRYFATTKDWCEAMCAVIDTGIDGKAMWALNEKVAKYLEGRGDDIDRSNLKAARDYALSDVKLLAGPGA